MASEEKTSGVERFFPGASEGYQVIEAPVAEVTLLEDRAQVTRQGRIDLSAGRNRLLVREVAPVLQDVSLRGSLSNAEGARVVDLRARRAQRVRVMDKPEAVAEIDRRLEALEERYVEISEDRSRCQQRYAVVYEMLAKGTREIAEDVAWGMANPQLWRDGLESLSKRARSLLDEAFGHYSAQRELIEELERLAARRAAAARRDVDFVGWIELDLEVERPVVGAELALRYVVPNALWRPLHTAELRQPAGGEATVVWSCLAAVWQNTGEDWTDVALRFSTARASLGTEPPLLAEDRLAAQRKSEQVVVQQREVAIQRAGAGGAGPAAEAPTAVELPGVDDGGEVRNLVAEGKSSVPSDGRPNLIPVDRFEAPADVQLVAVPELEPKVFTRVALENAAQLPILAGPVELVRESGSVGWTKTLFVAAGERFELSFGHDDAVRISRRLKREHEVDQVDRWTHNDTRVRLYLSNLAGEARRLEVRERIPVSEIEHVRVSLDEQGCEPRPEVDDDGICRFDVELAPHGQQRLQLSWRLSAAPGVEGVGGG